MRGPQKGLKKDIDNNDRLHTLELKNLNQQLDIAHKDNEQLQMAFFPRMSSTGPAVTSRRGENASMGINIHLSIRLARNFAIHLAQLIPHKWSVLGESD